MPVRRLSCKEYNVEWKVAKRQRYVSKVGVYTWLGMGKKRERDESRVLDV